MAWPQCCMTCFMLVFLHWSLTSSFWSTHVGFSVKQAIDIRFFFILGIPGRFEPNLLHISNDFPLLSLSAPTKSITRQIIYGNENSLFPLCLLPYSESRGPTRPPSLLEHLIQGLKAECGLCNLGFMCFIKSYESIIAQFSFLFSISYD